MLRNSACRVAVRERKHVVGLLVVLLAHAYVLAAPTAAPPAMQTAVLLKLLVFNKQIAASDSLAIHVLGPREIADAFEKAKGAQIGSARLTKVTWSAGLPDYVPAVLYLGDPGKHKEGLSYTRDKNVLSVSGVPKVIELGATLGVVIEEQRVKVYFDASNSEAEGATWESGLLKVVEGQQK